jgi:hypothetical protein
MPFSGGGGGQLTNHVHDNTPLQGGPLNFNNTTIGGMNSGDLTYSDGAALQQLAISAPNDQLRVSAGNIPEWFTPAAGASTWTTLADVTLGAPGTLDSGVFASHSVLTIYIFAAMSAAGGQAIIFNSDNAANQYCFRDIRNGTTFSTSNYACIQFGFAATTNWINSAWTITQRDATEKMVNGFVTEQTGTASTSIPSQALLSGMYRDAVNPITRVTSSNSGGVGVNFQTGSRMIVLGSA